MSTANLQPNAVVPDIPEDELKNIITQKILIAGINVYCYMHKDVSASDLPVQCHFLLHWRLGNYTYVEPAAKKIALLAFQQPNRTHDVIVVVFNICNHGDRMLDLRANQSWDEGNPLHGPDMYSIIMGTVKDVQLLIDFLPCYLYPKNERKITEWGISGVSIGGHTAWVLMAHEPRLTTGVIIIGCPSYKKLVSDRAQQSGYPVEAPYLPAPFLELVSKLSAEAVEHTKDDSSNPFIGKKLMIIVGGEKDLLVPWKESREYVNALNVGNGIKKVHIHQDAGHEFNAAMIEETAQFIATSGRLPENLPPVV